MTLAVILLMNIVATAAPVTAAPGYQSAPPAASASAAQDQASQPAPSANTKQAAPASTTTKPTAAPMHSPAKKPIHKKKPLTGNCDSATANPARSASHPASASQAGNSSRGTASPQDGKSAATTNCPPPKIVVRQGGTAEPSIQLEGEPGGGEASQDRVATNQMLGMTETNLKKVAGQQLSTTQQDSVTQIREFMEQSKAALAAGDMDRARTLAWKAKLLSEDLAKPQK